MTKPLTGTLVVSLDQAVAAPMTAPRLADAGARVIKLERPEGDFARYYDDVVKGQCTHYVWLNRGKESVVVDLTKPEDRQPVRGACSAKADVFLQNLKPGALAKLGYPIESAAQAASRAHLLLDLGLRRRGPVSRPQGLRPADPGRVRPCLHHRRTRRRRPASASRWSTSAPACMPTRRSWRRCIARGRTRARAQTSASPCSTP